MTPELRLMRDLAYPLATYIVSTRDTPSERRLRLGDRYVSTWWNWRTDCGAAAYALRAALTGNDWENNLFAGCLLTRQPADRWVARLLAAARITKWKRWAIRRL